MGRKEVGRAEKGGRVEIMEGGRGMREGEARGEGEEKERVYSVVPTVEISA